MSWAVGMSPKRQRQRLGGQLHNLTQVTEGPLTQCRSGPLPALVPLSSHQMSLSTRHPVSACLVPWHPVKPLSLQKLPGQAVSSLSSLGLIRLSLSDFLLLWALSWGNGGRGFHFPMVASSKVLAGILPHPSICLLPAVGNNIRSLLPCRSHPPLVPPSGLLERWPVDRVLDHQHLVFLLRTSWLSFTPAGIFEDGAWESAF